MFMQPQYTYSTEVFQYLKSDTENRITNRVQGKTEVKISVERVVNVPSFYLLWGTWQVDGRQVGDRNIL